MNTDVTWQQWQGDWQSAPAKIDVAALAHKVARARRRMFVWQAVEIVAALLATGLFALAGFQLRGSSHGLLLWLLIVIAWAGVVAKAWSRNAAWQVGEEGGRALLYAAERQARAGLRFALVKVVIALLVVIVASPWLWYAWHMLQHLPPSVVAPRLMMLAVPVALLGVLVWAAWYVPRKLAELHRIRTLLRQWDAQNKRE